MNYVESLNLFGVEAKEIPCIKGEGAPITTTEGAVGCFYMDTITGAVYKCTAIASGAYTWAPLDDDTENVVDIVQTTGDSETAVMSQKATTDELNEIKQYIRTTEKVAYSPEFESGKHIVQSGEIVAGSSFHVSQYIDVSEYKSIWLTTKMGWGDLLYAFYDADYVFISGLDSPTSGYATIENEHVDIPSNAKYIAVTKTNDIAFEMYVEVYVPFDIPETMEKVVKIESSITESYTAYVSAGTYIRKDNGKIYASANYGTTAYIPVNGGETIRLKGFYCPSDSSVSVCAYDSRFAFISAIITAAEDNGEGVLIEIGDNVAYIRATSTSNGSVIVDYIDRPIARKTIESAPYDFGTITDDAFVHKSDGTIQTNTSYFGVTDYIEVAARYLKIENPELSGNGGICEYDEHKNFISCLLSPEVNGGQYVVKLSPNAKYIRATVRKSTSERWLRMYPVSSIDDSETNDIVDSWMIATGNQIKTPHSKLNAIAPTITFIDDDTMTFDAVKRYHDIFANFGRSKNLYNMDANIDGYTLHSQNGSLYADATYSASDYIAVDADTQYTFSRNGSVAPTWLISITCFYDSQKAFISKVNSIASPFTTPAGTAYLRFATTTVRMEGSEGYIQLEKGDTATPYEEYHDGYTGIRGCYAVVTDYLDSNRDPNGELKNLLLSYEDEGFGMLFHAKWQDTYYMEGTNRNITLAEADYCKGMRKMREIGFVDYNYWVSPYGVMDEEIAAMCKRHGANCLLSTYNNTFIQNNGMNGNGESVDRYAIPRCSMGANDAEYPNFTLAHLKEQIEKCIQTNGWLIVTTHVAQWSNDDATADERLAEVVQYALDNGCNIKTFAEAYAERNCILLTNDIC